MNEEQQPVTTKLARTCYRHPDRETKLSCGRCGKPLCPDCMRHGPVGIRCAECLSPPKVTVQVAAPERVGKAIGIALLEALLWAAVIAALGWKIDDPMPNLLLSGIAGGLVGWSIWRICGRSANLLTGLTALGIGLAIPLLATLAMLPKIIAGFEPVHIARVLAAMALCGFFCWLIATMQHVDGGRNLFNR